LSSKISKDGTAKSGVPINTIRIGGKCRHYLHAFRIFAPPMRYLLLVPLFASLGVVAQQHASSEELRVTLSGVQFAANKSALTSESARDLDHVALLLKTTASATVEIGAHTDASGSAAYNLRLSQQRAQAVSSYLTKKGISAKRLTAKGYGESNLLNRCKRGVRCSDAEMRQNRRVELRVQGVPADSASRAPWLALGGVLPPRKPVQEPAVPKWAATPSPVPPDSALAARPEQAGGQAGVVPRPLPRTFTGYTIEILCADKPLIPGAVSLYRYDLVLLRQVPGGPYCYYVGAFFTMPEATQYLSEIVRSEFPAARVAQFVRGEPSGKDD